VSDFDKMNAEDKALWIEALRSDKFKQGKFELRTEDDCNCCLGVLAEIKNIPYQFHQDEFTNFTEYDFGDMGGMDAAVPAGFCGLSDPAISKLIELNDNYDKTFPEIADFIEKNL
jgi:hypothetical protein